MPRNNKEKKDNGKYIYMFYRATTAFSTDGEDEGNEMKRSDDGEDSD